MRLHILTYLQKFALGFGETFVELLHSVNFGGFMFWLIFLC